MNIWAWILIGWLAFEALVTVSMVGKPRTTLTPRLAVVTLIILAVVGGITVLAATT